MNKVILTGRVTKEPNAIVNVNGTTVVSINLAVKRKFTEKSGDTDFIRCVAFGAVAKSIESRLYKGVKIYIVGKIHTGSYTNKDGYKEYTMEVYLEEFDIVEHTQAYKESHKKYIKDDDAASFEGFKTSNGSFEIPKYMDGFLNIDEALADMGIDSGDLPFR